MLTTTRAFFRRPAALVAWTAAFVCISTGSAQAGIAAYTHGRGLGRAGLVVSSLGRHHAYSLLHRYRFSLVHHRHSVTSLQAPRLETRGDKSAPAGQSNDPMPGGAEDFVLAIHNAPPLDTVPVSSERLSSADAAGTRPSRAPPSAI